MVKWQDVNRVEQDKFLNKASYLISKGYYDDYHVEDLAIKIYTSHQKARGIEQD